MVTDRGNGYTGMTLTVAFTLAAALSSAVNLMTQHSASVGAPKREKGWRLVAYMFRQPPWLFGWIAAAVALLALVSPLASIVLSIWLFDERFTDSPARITVTALAMAVLAVGVIALSRTAPKD